MHQRHTITYISKHFQVTAKTTIPDDLQGCENVRNTFTRLSVLFVSTNHVAGHRISCVGHWVGDWWLRVWLKRLPRGLPVSEWNDMRRDWLAVLKDRWRARVGESQTPPDLTSLLMPRIADSMYGWRDTWELLEITNDI